MNDLFGCERETAYGNDDNLVAVLTTHDGLTMNEAMTKVVALVNAELTTLDFLSHVAEVLPDPSASTPKGYAPPLPVFSSGWP